MERKAGDLLWRQFAFCSTFFSFYSIALLNAQYITVWIMIFPSCESIYFYKRVHIFTRRFVLSSKKKCFVYCFRFLPPDYADGIAAPRISVTGNVFVAVGISKNTVAQTLS